MKACSMHCAGHSPGFVYHVRRGQLLEDIPAATIAHAWLELIAVWLQKIQHAYLLIDVSLSEMKEKRKEKKQKEKNKIVSFTSGHSMCRGCMHADLAATAVALQ